VFGGDLFHGSEPLSVCVFGFTSPSEWVPVIAGDSHPDLCGVFGLFGAAVLADASIVDLHVGGLASVIAVIPIVLHGLPSLHIVYASCAFGPMLRDALYIKIADIPGFAR